MFSSSKAVKAALAALILAACVPAADDPAQEARQISGTVKGWPFAAAAVVASLEMPPTGSGNPAPASQQRTPVAQGSISAEGQVDLLLPEALPADLLGDIETHLGGEAGCAAVTPGETLFSSLLADLAVEQEGEALATLLHSAAAETGETFIKRIYATRDASASGECLSPETSPVAAWDLDLDLRAGWNIVLATYSESAKGSPHVKLTTGTVPGDAEWQFVPADAQATR